MCISNMNHYSFARIRLYNFHPINEYFFHDSVYFRFGMEFDMVSSTIFATLEVILNLSIWKFYETRSEKRG
jgi:hypothetical protein